MVVVVGSQGEQVDRLRSGISVVMSAYNEAAVIRDCLESVKDWAAEIVVVNGASEDRTQAIAREYTDQVLTTTNKLMLNVNKNLAIDAATCAWVLLLDPDERVSPELAEELRSIAAGRVRGLAGYWMPRRNFELGRWIRAMGQYPSYQLRFFRNGQARFPCRHIHEMVKLSGEAGYLRGDLIHTPPQGLAEYVHKRNLYSEHRAVFLYERGVRFRAWNLLLRPLYSFIKYYLLKGGWREGVPGLIIAVSGAYGTFLQDAKLWQKWQAGRSDRGSDSTVVAWNGRLPPASDAQTGAEASWIAPPSG